MVSGLRLLRLLFPISTMFDLQNNLSVFCHGLVHVIKLIAIFAVVTIIICIGLQFLLYNIDNYYYINKYQMIDIAMYSTNYQQSNASINNNNNNNNNNYNNGNYNYNNILGLQLIKCGLNDNSMSTN